MFIFHPSVVIGANAALICLHRRHHCHIQILPARTESFLPVFRGKEEREQEEAACARNQGPRPGQGGRP